MESLVVVESPAKAQTIKKYLGKGFEVMASYGHVRDLPKGELGVDIKDDYKPKYVVPVKSKKTLTAIKRAAGEAKVVYLATDLDREGEAIAWHIVEGAKLKGGIKRIVFSEITKEAIDDAIKNPRDIDYHLVDAQQARRVLDRLVGYGLSPLLWKKVYKGLSAGRVQSVAVRMVVEREREIKNFKPEEYWAICAILEKDKKEFEANLVAKDNKRIDKLDIKSEKDAQSIVNNLKSADYVVDNVEEKTSQRNPYAPYTTSTLQQDASIRLNFSPKQTMRLAQMLYEDGRITYMRTDSTNLSSSAVKEAREHIRASFGGDYLPPEPKIYKTKLKGAQEAHEAIRPTHPKNSPEEMNISDSKLAKLYDLIWRRMMASQMSAALFDEAKVSIRAKQYLFQANGRKIKFEGWLKIYPERITQTQLPQLAKGDKCLFKDLKKQQHFTQPPSRFNEASLIKALEEYGIGRPSTYAPTISTIQERGYVKKEDRKLVPEEIGFVVNDLLVEHFSEIVDYNFTAQIENEFDKIADGNLDWHEMVGEFYRPFSKKLLQKENDIEKQDLNRETGEKCPECSKPLLIKRSRYGQFIGCSGFPICKFMKKYISESDQKKIDEANAQIGKRNCPRCGGKLSVRKGRYGMFIGCSNYPKCKYLERIKKENSKAESD